MKVCSEPVYVFVSVVAATVTVMVFAAIDQATVLLVATVGAAVSSAHTVLAGSASVTVAV